MVGHENFEPVDIIVMAKSRLGLINCYGGRVELKFDARLCNGSTSEFGSDCQGSNPCRATSGGSPLQEK